MKLAILALLSAVASAQYPVRVGDRPIFLIEKMEDSELKTELANCAAETKEFHVSDWSIGHRGACMQYPEHTLESYLAAIIQGAGIVECDVTFTKDKELVCRHAQCDLHTTTDIVTRPEMNTKCTTPWAPGIAPKCCTSDFTLEELKTLCAKMDASIADAETAKEYIGGTADWRTDLYTGECPKIPTHAESIALISDGGRKFTPELKTPQVDMPFDGFTQEMYAQKMIDEYVAAGVPAENVWAQSFLWDDVLYWLESTPDFGKQAVALEGTYAAYDYTTEEFDTHFADIIDAGANIVAPPMWMLVDQEDGEIVASNYTEYVKNKGFDIITWTLERSGLLQSGGGWYFQTTNGDNDNSNSSLVVSDGFVFEFLHALQTEVGILGIFSDWPATTTFYANCMGLGLLEADEPEDDSGVASFTSGLLFTFLPTVVALLF
eukprot:7534872-Ditylum_brightwellii.AAC.1